MGVHNKVSEDSKQEILRRVKAGESKYDIAKDMNWSYRTILDHSPKKNLTKTQIEEIINLSISGTTDRDISLQYQVSRKLIRRYTRHINPHQGRIHPEKKKALILRISAGEEVTAIARELKITKSTAGIIARSFFRDFYLSEQQKKTISDKRHAGMKLVDIASEMALPIRIVTVALGIGDRSSRYPEETRQAAIRAVEAGETMGATAERLMVSRAAVSRWFKAAVATKEVRKPFRNGAKADDFQFFWITRLDPSLEDWRRLIVEWFESQRPSTGVATNTISAFIERYLIALHLPKTPADLLKRGQSIPDFFSVACPKSDASGERYSKMLYSFIEWVLDSPDFADKDEDGETLRLSHLYRNPFNQFSKGSNHIVGSADRAESNKVVLAYYLISDLRKRIVLGPNFVDWTWVRGLTGRDTINGKQGAKDWFPVIEDQIDRNDPDCVWRWRHRENALPILEMWSPIRWVLNLIHLQTTSRVGQTRMVDSGEADTFIWKNDEFIPNLGPLRQGTIRNPREQGIFRRPSAHDTTLGAKIYLYFNSNKTADIGKIGKGKGQVCPWPRMENLDEDPYYWLAKLRDWQMKYNPIDRLTAWSELKGDRKLSPLNKDQLAEYPETAFLFRAPEFANESGPISSSAAQDAWQKLMSGYETILLKEGFRGPSGEPIELINRENGRAWSSPHATRVSLITHLILDGDVPIELMMKIVGHTRFMMTVYYTKVGLNRIQEAIKGAAEKLDAIKYKTFERDLVSTEAERIREKVAFNIEDWQTVLAVDPANRTPVGWLHLIDGICLAGGNAENTSLPGCHNGGPEIVGAQREKKALHGPVPGGVRNCCRCRWKCAGKSHVPALAATLNNRSYHLHRASAKAIAAERERNTLMQDKARIESIDEPYARTREFLESARRYEASMQTMQQYALDVVALNRMIERIMALPNNSDNSMVLASQGDLLTLNAVIEETDSELLVLAGICADIEFFPDLDPGSAVFEFAQLLDKAFEREGQPFILARLSEHEKMVAANAIMRELEEHANPNNPILARRQVVEIMDRGQSLETILGINLKNILRLPGNEDSKPVSIRLISDPGGKQ